MTTLPPAYVQPGYDTKPSPPGVGPFQAQGLSSTQVALGQMNIGQAAWQFREQMNTPWQPNLDPPTPYQQPGMDTQRPVGS
jgi:hypothetical protein